MKRNDFLKTATILTGGFLWSCEKVVVDNLISPLNIGNIDIEEAQRYFEYSYLPKFQNEITSSLTKERPLRKANFQLAEKKKVEDKEFISVPIEYENEYRPTIVVWSEKTSFIKDLAKYYHQPINERLIIVKDDNGIKVFLAQVARDVNEVTLNNKKKLDIENFTGTVCSATWNDSLNQVFILKDGVIITSYDNEIDKISRDNSRARVQDCQTFTVSIQSVTMATCGPACAEATLHHWQKDVTICGTDPLQEHNRRMRDGYYNSAGFLTNAVYQYGGVAASYNTSIEVGPLLSTPSSNARARFNSNLNSVLSVTGLITDIHGWNLETAGALARSVGASMEQYYPLASKVGKVVGRAGLVISGTQFVVGLVDGWTLQDDAVNTSQVLLGVLALYSAPWVAVAIGGVALVIAVGAIDIQ